MRYGGISYSISFIQMFTIVRAKCSFYRAANSIISKIGRIASKEIVLQLVKSKCVPVLLYGLEACELSKALIASLDFVINRFLRRFLAPTT